MLGMLTITMLSPDTRYVITWLLSSTC